MAGRYKTTIDALYESLKKVGVGQQVKISPIKFPDFGRYIQKDLEPTTKAIEDIKGDIEEIKNEIDEIKKMLNKLS